MESKLFCLLLVTILALVFVTSLFMYYHYSFGG